MAAIQQWNIKARSHTCADTEKEFAEGDCFYTALFEDGQEDGFVRRDYSEKSWEKLRGELKPFSFWRSTFELPPVEEKPEVVQKAGAEALLRRLIEDEEAHTENARFILAIMLERKKIFVQTDVQDSESARILIYEHRKSGEVFIVKDPQLKLEEITSVQKEVSELLGGGQVKEQEQGGVSLPSESESISTSRPQG